MAKKREEKEKPKTPAAGDGGAAAPATGEKEKTPEPEATPAKVIPAAETEKEPEPLVLLQDTLRDAAVKFIRDNKDDVALLGEDIVRTILAQQVTAIMPSIPTLPENASAEMHAMVAEILKARSQAFQMVAKAEREHTAAVQRVRGNAATLAGTLAKSVLGIGAGIAAKFLIGL
ncbi:MAG TPA: hypothetical protein VEK08_09010 [Planctomycetota bacterium]|nr:hypothetical protein [Planctomycetota bacterium]